MSEEEKNKNSSNANEPLPSYGSGNESKSITVFSSLEEMEESKCRYLAGLTPLQHLEYGTMNIKRIFAEKLKENPTLGNRIYFD